MFSFQERAWRRMLTWWSDCWSGGLNVLVPPWEEKGATVCLLPLKRPLRSQKILQEMDPLLKKTDASPCECKASLYYITMWYIIYDKNGIYNNIPVWCFVTVRFGGEEQHEENRVHLGNAIMSFYSALIDLLGRCAPEMHVSTFVC